MSVVPNDLESELPERIALVHDWLAAYVGGERVLEQMISLYPQSALYTSVDVLPERDRAFLQGKRPITSFAHDWPFVRKHYRQCLPLLMLAIEQLDLSESELVLSSSSAIGKGVLIGPEQLHISYVHSPMRYAWDLQHQYLKEARLTKGMRGMLARWLLHRARIWDSRTANGVDHFIANSQFIARRIWRVYRREAAVIYPPVDVTSFELRETKEDFYLTASRLVPYKKVTAIVEAFRALPGRRLVVVGDGSEMRQVKAAAGHNVEILGHQPTAVLRDLMQRAKAFVFAAEEDFGIAPVEALACGTPVIAYGRGGALETVRDTGPRACGHFFQQQTAAAVAAAVVEFEQRQHELTPRSCRDNALRFSAEIFRERYRQFVQTRWEEFRAERRPRAGEAQARVRAYG